MVKNESTDAYVGKVELCAYCLAQRIIIITEVFFSDKGKGGGREYLHHCQVLFVGWLFDIIVIKVMTCIRYKYRE
jgi:hypothetical protein